MSIQEEQLELLVEVSITRSSTYSCVPDGPLENSLIESV